MPLTFDALFHAATASAVNPTGDGPYGYQCRLACGPEVEPENPETLTAGARCESHLIDIPTGLGKTAAVAMAWLWNRVAHPDPRPSRHLAAPAGLQPADANLGRTIQLFVATAQCRERAFMNRKPQTRRKYHATERR